VSRHRCAWPRRVALAALFAVALVAVVVAALMWAPRVTAESVSIPVTSRSTSTCGQESTP
jgi:hypothetical protein